MDNLRSLNVRAAAICSSASIRLFAALGHVPISTLSTGEHAACRRSGSRLRSNAVCRLDPRRLPPVRVRRSSLRPGARILEP